MDGCVKSLLPLLKSTATLVASVFRQASMAKKHVDDLEEKMIRLQNSARDVLKKVHADAQKRGDAAHWISRVAKTTKSFTEVQQKLRSANGFWERYNISRIAIDEADEAERMLKEVEEKGLLAGPDRLMDIECEPEPVGIDSKVKQLKDFAKSSSHDVIMGIYGMGGVGKATLVRRFHNRLARKFDCYVKNFLSGKHGDLDNGKLLLTPKDHFDVVIFIVVKKDSTGQNNNYIQQSIADRLGLTWGATHTDEKDRAREIRGTLERMKFLIIMVDVWDKLDLQKLGIPSDGHHNMKGSKVIFTTRIATVCTDIRNTFSRHNKEMHLRCLKWQEAWKLFKDKIGKRDTPWTRETEKQAKKVARRCGGLPIALNTIASIMAPKSKLVEWQIALQSLDARPSRLDGLDRALGNLKLSYDNLKSDALRKCFLFGAMFPRHEKIPNDWLVDYLIGEKLIKDLTDMSNARLWGHGLIANLRDASLLESFHSREVDDHDDDDDDNIKGDGEGMYSVGEHHDDDDYVRMHDMYRVLALWLQENKWLMQASAQLQTIANPDEWGSMEKVSLMKNKLYRIAMSTTQCNNLHTLLLANNPLEEIPDSLFGSTPCLRVLDLSSTNIRRLPSSVKQLHELEYLDLYESKKLISLPEELKQLTNLRFLNLDHSPSLKTIPHGLISSLTSLQVLRMYDSYGGWRASSFGAGLGLEELKSLVKLEELYITIEKRDFLEKFHKSRSLAEVTSGLLIRGCQGLQNLKLPDDLEQYMSLRLWLVGVFDCNDLEKLQIGSHDHQKKWPRQVRGRRLELRGLDRTKIEWVIGAWLQKLEYLIITDCKIEGPLIPKMRQKGKVDAFEALTYLKLQNLSNLTSICKHPLFSSLRILKVDKCSTLRKFPFGAESAKNIRRIHCEKEWWDRLRWDNETLRSELEKCLIKTKEEEIYQKEMNEEESEEEEEEVEN